MYLEIESPLARGPDGILFGGILGKLEIILMQQFFNNFRSKITLESYPELKERYRLKRQKSYKTFNFMKKTEL